MTYIHLHPCANTAALADFQARDDRLQENAEAHFAAVDERALELAATYHNDQELRDLLNDAPGNDDEFTAALNQLYTNILESGREARIPRELIEAIDTIAKNRFRDRAERELNLETSKR